MRTHSINSFPCRVLHLFHLYLPHTMNWAFRLMMDTPGTVRWVAAPWFVRNTYYTADIRPFVRPLQTALGLLPTDEWQYRRFWNLLVRAERPLAIYQKWLLKQLQVEKPDILHAHFGPLGCDYLDLSQRLGVPLVTSFYGYDYESVPFQKPAYREKYRRLFQGAAAITCAGPYGREVLLRQGCPPERLHILPMSMRPAEFPFFSREKQAGALRLVQVASFTEKKGFMDTLRAVQIALKTCPGLQLTIAGEQSDPALVRQLRAFIRDQHLENAVQWLDFVPHRELPAFLRPFDVFIQPSCYTRLRDCEGGPVSILEAQASGMPVISTTHFDIPQEVVDGQTGLLAPEKDPLALARHIERFYGMDNETFQCFARAAAAHVRAGFDVAETGRRLRGVYEGVLRTSGS